MTERPSPVAPPRGASPPTPGAVYWLIICAVAPLLTIAALVLLAMAGAGIMDVAVLTACVLTSAALGALMPQALPRMRSLPRATRAGWTIAGALAAGTAVLPLGFALLFSVLYVVCGVAGCSLD